MFLFVVVVVVEVIFPLTSSVLSLAGTNDVNYVSVLHVPDQGDLSYVVTG